MKKLLPVFLLVFAFIAITAFYLNNKKAQDLTGRLVTGYEIGDAVDSLNGVKVYYNGAVSNTAERHKAVSGYNYGLRWQCVEFVKRYYYDYLDHQMPDTYGHAKDFFDKELKDGALNKKRNLIQYKNGGKTAPKTNDLLVFRPHSFNPYGHVAIVSRADSSEMEIIQQNPGPSAPSRVTYTLTHKNGKWTVDRSDLLGWLRKE
ncbi:MAG TPA: CHAP domain-containing protein [Bacteroidia bacterium]|nr:CHAP domain-containing protein [Bacteroidia bacterium]